MPRLFLSTPSARRATVLNNFFCLCIRISIHALREEGDLCTGCRFVHRVPISIHALREEGDSDFAQLDKIEDLISIHALREEGDAVTTA